MCLMEPAQILPLPFLCLCAEWNWEKSLTVNITAPKCYDHKPQFPMLYDSKFSRLFSHHSIVISPFFLLPSFCLDNTPQFKTKVTCNKRHGLFCAFLSLVFQGILKKKAKIAKNICPPFSPNTTSLSPSWSVFTLSLIKWVWGDIRYHLDSVPALNLQTYLFSHPSFPPYFLWMGEVSFLQWASHLHSSWRSISVFSRFLLHWWSHLFCIFKPAFFFFLLVGGKPAFKKIFIYLAGAGLSFGIRDPHW